VYTDTTTLIDDTIANLETLRQVFADDFALCRRSGLAGDAHKCGAALEAISLLLPRLQVARTTQDYEPSPPARHCPGCE
jgi:hypothetical protein